MKIVILDGLNFKNAGSTFERIHAMGDVSIFGYTPPEKVAECARDADILLVTNRIRLTGSVLDACPKVRYIGVMSTGYNAIDVEAANSRGITVKNTPEYSTPAVAQLTFALLLELCRHVGRYSRDVRAGHWAASHDDCFRRYPPTELYGKTIGIIGYGSIGRAVARIAKAFDMQVLAFTRTPRQDSDVRFCSLDELLAESDVVSLHCPLTADTRGIISERAINRMKPGAFLINTARGPLLDEEAVARALQSGQIAGLAADVAAKEPIPEDSPLLTAPNCIITPHIGWATRESCARLIDFAADNLQEYLLQ